MRETAEGWRRWCKRRFSLRKVPDSPGNLLREPIGKAGHSAAMLMYRRYFWITRIAPLAIVGAGIIALLPSDFKAAATTMTATAAIAQPAAPKVSMPAPKLLSTEAIAALPAPVASQPVTTDAAAPSSMEPITVAATTDATASVPDAGLAALQDAQIGSSGVNVRAGASKDFAVLFTLQPGASVKTRETLNGWVHVFTDNGDGWIYSSYLGGDQTTASNDSTNTASTDARSSTSNSLVGHALRLRSRAQVYDSPGGDRVYVLDAGERVRVADASDNWIRIVTDTDESGWLRLR